MSYLWTQAELDAHQEVPFSIDELRERYAFRSREHTKACNDMVVDLSFFGLKDLGRMNLHELVALYERPYGKMTVDKWLTHGFVCFLSDEPDEREKLYYSKTALDKFEFMKVNHDHKYQVDIEIMHRYEKEPDNFLIKQRYALKVFIDGELMTDCGPKNHYLWHHIDLCYKDSENFVIGSINKRANFFLKQWKLNITKMTEELMMNTMHPKRLIRHLELGGEIDDF